MAKNKTTKQTTENMSVFSQLDIETYAQANLIISDSQAKAEGLAERIAGQLYIVAQKKLYELDDYKTVHDWAMAQHDIAKGTVSDSINTFARFGDGVTGLIKEEYQQFTFSTLMKMKNLTDEQIELAGINPTMSRSQVVDAIKGLKVLEEKQAELPKLEKEWSLAYKTFSNAVPDVDERMSFITNVVPEFFEHEHKASPVEYEDLIREVNNYNQLSGKILDFIGADENNAQLLAEESGRDINFIISSNLKEEADMIALTKAIDRLTDSANAEEQYYKQENEAAENDTQGVYSEPDTESYDDEEPASMPTVTININNFRKENGALDKKHLLDVIWSSIQDVENSQCDVIISKFE